MSSDAKRIKLSSSAEEFRDDNNAGKYKYQSAPTEESFDDHTVYVVNKVFGIDLLREKILGHYLNNVDTTPREICSARLVQKSWLRNVNKLLFKSNQPLCNLKLGTQNSAVESDSVRVNWKTLLNRFVNTMQNSIEENIPPIQLKIYKDFFSAENHQSFTHFLHVCATSLVDLEIFVPENGGSMPLIFPETLTFPSLKKLTINFCKDDTTTNELGNVNYDSNNSYVVPFVKFILNRAERVEEIAFNSEERDLIPTGIEDLIFPRSLKKLVFNCVLTTNQLEMLARSSLPNLVYLCVQISESEMPDGLLFRILDTVKTTLRHLILDMDNHSDFPGHVKCLQFPVMNYLRICELNSFHVELGTQTLPLQICLPLLKKLTINNQTVERLQKWTSQSCLSKVSYLCMSWCNASSAHPVEFSANEMQAVHRTFPNVKKFVFLGHEMERKAVQYLFKEMRQLTNLNIGLIEPDAENSRYWDSLLIGVPIGVLPALRYNPVHWENDDMKIRFNLPCIKNLTALRKFRLYSVGDQSRLNQPLISNLTFRHVLQKMPKLKQVEFGGRFKPSRKMSTYLKFQKIQKSGHDFYTWLH